MDKNDIVTEVFKSGIIEEVIGNIAKVTKERFEDYYLNDLKQDICEQLLKKDEDLLIRMKESGDLNFYIIRMIKNNLCSYTSNYYYKYKRWFTSIDENYEWEEE